MKAYKVTISAEQVSAVSGEFAGMEVLVRVHKSGTVEADVRRRVGTGARVWTPVGLLGGTVEETA